MQENTKNAIICLLYCVSETADLKKSEKMLLIFVISFLPGLIITALYINISKKLKQEA